MLKRSVYRTVGQISFQAFGVSIGIASERPSHLDEIYKHLKKVFPQGLAEIEAANVKYQFFIKREGSDGYTLFLNDEKIASNANRELFFQMVASHIRLTVAEFADRRVFLHAGVVGWKGRAIVIPARSFSGKSTLVSELVRKGADYYSDEYAVLDAAGNVQPFPKWLSMRPTEPPFVQTDYPVGNFGGVAATRTIPVGLVLLATFDRRKKISRRWQPKKLSRGQGVMEILPHTLPIRNQPKFVLEVLSNLAARAIIVKTIRGEAAEFAERLLYYFEHHTP